MTNNYDDQPQSRDLDREEPTVRYYQQQQLPPRDLDPGYPSGISPGFVGQNMPQAARGELAEAAGIRSRLATNLRAAAEEARNLETFYNNFAQTLELCLSQLETKK